MPRIFHLALAHDWSAAQEQSDYRISTRGRTLAEEGFIHASRGDQWQATRERFYADVSEPLVLLVIDTDRLASPLVEEPAMPGGETFPHIYGPLNLDAVVSTIDLAAPAPALRGDAAGAAPQEPGGESFSALYFREMFANVLLASVVMLFVVLAALGGLALDPEWGALWGTAVGLGLGVLAARALSSRRRGQTPTS